MIISNQFFPWEPYQTMQLIIPVVFLQKLKQPKKKKKENLVTPKCLTLKNLTFCLYVHRVLYYCCINYFNKVVFSGYKRRLSSEKVCWLTGLGQKPSWVDYEVITKSPFVTRFLLELNQLRGIKNSLEYAPVISRLNLHCNSTLTASSSIQGALDLLCLLPHPPSPTLPRERMTIWGSVFLIEVHEDKLPLGNI